MPAFPEAPLRPTDDRRTLLLALGAAGVTLAVALGIVGLPAVNACSTDPRGVVTCLRDMADRKFDLPGRKPGRVADKVPADAIPGDPPVPPPLDVAEIQPPAAPPGPSETPSTASPDLPAEAAAAPSADPSAIDAARPTVAAQVPGYAVPASPVPASGAIEPVPPADTALSWGAAPTPEHDVTRDESAARPDRFAVERGSSVEDETPALEAAVPASPLAEEPADAPQAGPAAAPAVPAAGAPAGAPLVVANAEPATAQPPPPTIAAPVVLAPTIDAIELDGSKSFVSGSGPAGALMRLYADGRLIGESPVEEGRWLVEGSNLLDNPRRELRVEAIEPDTGKLLGVAAITVEIELPDGGAPPDERPEQTPELGSGVAPAPQADPAPPVATSPPEPAQPPATATPPDASAVADSAPAAEPGDQPLLVEEPEAEPEIAAIEPDLPPAPLPPLDSVLPQGESASVEILAPSTLQPTTLPSPTGTEQPSTITLPAPEAPALIAQFDAPKAAPTAAAGQPVTILRLLPFGDPDEGRYNVGKAIIRRGDTLWSIARRYYGHGIHYRTIFHANRELIRRPSRIFPGQIFELPLVTDD